MSKDKPPVVKAVFFDIGNVLLKFSIRKVIGKFSSVVGRHPLKIARYLWSSDVGHRIERGEMSSEQIYEMFQKELGFKGTFAQFRILWCDHFTLDRASLSLLKKSAARVPTYLLSNTNALHIDFIRERYGFIDEVAGAIYSHEVGARKPEPAIYKAALKLSKTAPHETVFVDDLKPNVAAARKLGIIGIQFEGAADLRNRFKSLGIL